MIIIITFPIPSSGHCLVFPFWLRATRMFVCRRCSEIQILSSTIFILIIVVIVVFKIWLQCYCMGVVVKSSSALSLLGNRHHRHLCHNGIIFTTLIIVMIINLWH